MKKYLWLGLTFLSLSWLFLIPIFATPDITNFLIFLTAGVFLNILSFEEKEINSWNRGIKDFNKKYLLILIPFILSMFLIPLPYTIGPIIIVSAILIDLVIFYFKRHITKISLGMGISGLILTIQAFFIPAYVILSSHIHRVDFLSGFVSPFCNLFGLKTSVNKGIMFVQSTQQTYPITTTIEKLGFLPWFNIFIGFLFLFILFVKIKKRWFYIPLFLLLSFVYVILRYILTIFIFSETNDLSIFLDLAILSISFIPFGLLLTKFFSFKDINFDLSCFKKFRFDKKNILSVFLIFIFIFSLVGSFVFQDPGYEKAGRILIDEYHTDWEPSNIEMDKEWYGENSTYNFYSWAQWLDNYYEISINEDKFLTSDLIKNYDILVLKCPTYAYKDQEINDILDFVLAGGGLYLMADHTNLFGMNENLNELSSHFDIIFNTDSTYDLETEGLSTYKHLDFLSHPIVQNVESFNFLTSCSLQAPINSENIIVGNKLIAEPGTYSTMKFFRENKNIPDIDHGLILQSAAVKYGKGRILAFTDSTVFSNFCIFMSDYTEFNLGAIEYLNRENAYSYINTLLFLASLVSMAVLFKLLRKEKKILILFLVICIGLFSFSSSSIIFSNINKINYSLPKAHSDYTKICFEQEHSNFITTVEPYPYTYDFSNYYNVFYVWTQRLGYIPSLEETLENSVIDSDVVVIINPITSFTDIELSSLESYVNNGGNILVLESRDNKQSTSNELLSPFDIKINFNLGNITDIFDGEGLDLYNFSNNISYLNVAIKNQSEGKIVVVLDSYIFSDESMSGADGRFVIPDDNQRWIFDQEYLLFEDLIFGQ